MRFPCFAVVKGGKMMSFATLEENAQYAMTPGSKVIPCVIIPRSECEQDHNELTCFEIRAIFKVLEILPIPAQIVEKSLDILLVADCKNDASFYGMFWAKNRSEQLTTPGEKWEPIRVDVGVYHILRPDSNGRIATKREMIPFFQWRADRDKPFAEELVKKLAEANNPKDNPAPESESSGDFLLTSIAKAISDFEEESGQTRLLSCEIILDGKTYGYNGEKFLLSKTTTEPL
jgi:hypothetical protein